MKLFFVLKHFFTCFKTPTFFYKPSQNCSQFDTHQNDNCIEDCREIPDDANEESVAIKVLFFKKQSENRERESTLEKVNYRGIICTRLVL